MELIKPQKQKVWKWPAATNFTTGGIGTGFYLIGWLLVLPQKENWLALLSQPNADWFSLAVQTAVFKLLGPALVALGFVALTTEAGRPQRGINLFRHLRRSWMSRETLAFVIFAPFAGLDWLFPSPLLRAIGALAALALMICQGFIMYRSRGVTAWHNPILIVMFVTSGFASGGGLFLLAMIVFGLIISNTLLLIVLVSALLNLGVWLAYLSNRKADFRNATRELREKNSLALTIGVGHFIPALLLLYAIIANSGLKASVLFITGLALIAGALAQKFGLVLQAGYLRAIGLRVPFTFQPASAK